MRENEKQKISTKLNSIQHSIEAGNTGMQNFNPRIWTPEQTLVAHALPQMPKRAVGLLSDDTNDDRAFGLFRSSVSGRGSYLTARGAE
jgi:hypothetical protein